MNSLVNYGSDDDYDDSSEEKQTDWRGTSSKEKQQTSSHKESDANYEEVQMDLSEESNDSPKEASRRSRDRDRERKDRHEDHRSSRSSRDKDSKSRSEKEDRYRDRRDRDRKSRRSSSRERRRSRTPPRKSDRDRHSRSRSRSRSRDRSGRRYSKRYDRGGSKSRQVDRNDSQKSESEEKRNAPSEGDRFFMPGITGRFRDQIERRKQLWQKKDNDTKDTKNGQSKKVWETTTFAQDTDGKVANKFKRLMGIKGSSESTGTAVDVLKKQEEMFSSMEQQYEVARTATHTMRGVGLGFGSYQR